MKNLTPRKNRRVRRNIRLAAFALTAAGVVAAAGTAAAPASAAPSVYTPAKLEHGLLTVKGTAGSDEIVLRLQDGSPEILEVDVGTTAMPTTASSATTSRGSSSQPRPAATS